MSRYRVQYSPENPIVPYFRNGFLYSLHETAEGITSMNRIRKWCATQGVADISRGMILGLLARSHGKFAGEAVNSHTHIATICFIHVAKFREALFQAIAAGEIRICSGSHGISANTTLH